MKYVKKIIMGAFFIYSFNMIAINFNIVLPINLWTIAFASIYDFFGIMILLLIKLSGG